MFSGGDSSDGINSLNQLGSFGFINHAAVSNAMAAGQNIDWAQLAQQWIQMRDNTGSETKTAPTTEANRIINPISYNCPKFEEKGEADMDMDDEEQTDEKAALKLENNFASTSVIHNSMNQPWFYSEENTSQTGSSQWNAWPNREDFKQTLPSQNIINNRPTNPTAHIPSLLKITVPHPNEIRVMPDIPNQSEMSSNMIDAAKRKGLPAWIREGLEKMEREKQKQLEKEQHNKYNSNSSDDDVVSSKNIVAKNVSSVNGACENVDEESTDNEDAEENVAAKAKRNVIVEDDDEEEDTYSLVGKTYEQKLADLMIVVRRTLTELLLEATNEEISKVADETVKSFKSKASSAQVIRKSALSTITGKLGLAAYGDSSSEGNSDDDDDAQDSSKKTGQSESDTDSEEEIRNAIRVKRRAFVKTSEEIEERVVNAAAREEEKLKYFLRKEEEEESESNRIKQERALLRDPLSSGYSGNNIFKGYEKDFGEITETKMLNGKRQRDNRSNRRERTTRFSDNKDKFVALSTTASFIANMNTSASAGGSNTTTVLTNTSQRQTVPDLNGLLPNYANAGVTSVLNAADAALEKVLKHKASASPEKQNNRRARDRKFTPSKKRQRRSNSKNERSRSNSSSSSTSSSSTSSTSSSSDSSSTSRSSHHSKHSYRSETKHKAHATSSSSTGRKYEKSHKDRRDDRKYSSSYTKRDRESTSSRYHRNKSSDSDDEYSRRHKRDSRYSRNSSYTHSYTSSRRDHDRDREPSRSRSRSSYSSSSNRRQ